MQEQETGCGCGCGTPDRQTLSLSAPPAAVRDGEASLSGAPPADTAERHRIEQAHVPAGEFTMGDATGHRNRGDAETPLHRVAISALDVDVTTVTNADFARFVEDTSYRTEAERFGFSAGFQLALAAEEADVMGPAAGPPWWRGVRGADWRHPGGRRSDLDGLDDHPVAHMSWHDAQAYCVWAGRRLPTEAEGEYVARGGLEGATFPWGEEPIDQPPYRANVWQGEFPYRNTGADGYLTTAPVRSFAPNGYGLWQSVGNVWEWCEDVFHPATYRRGTTGAARTTVTDPTGPEGGGTRVLRGGSDLCHASYCNRYRNAARSRNTPDSSMGNAGFRTVSPRRSTP